MHQTKLNPEETCRKTVKFPTISQPKIVGCFSVGPDREYLPTGENLKYLNLPKPGKRLAIDLNDGFEIRRPKPDSAKQERIDHLLRFILNNEDRLRNRDESGGKRKRLSCDFVCFRGLLRMIMCTPYERRTPWIVMATRYRGTIYLCAKETEQKLAEEASQTEQQRRFCYYGFKFEQHILTDEPDRPADTSCPVNESEEFCALFSTTLDGSRVLYGAEMDGITPINPPLDKQTLPPEVLNRLEFVEVKVKRRETNQRQAQNFYRFKTRNWWCQSFLVNVQRLVVGLRNDRGVVDEIREMTLSELDRDSRQYWSASVCMDFCAQFLGEVRRLMNGVDCSGTVFRFTYDAERSNYVGYSIFKGTNDESFLPDWYCEAVE
ncbi:decapping nuclease DXO homolog [Uranotaenia lowii]|uniref:decapping nuclease DXO homolog n=1 Tax=Uranotaenia lowii TaxID=190385 RepID=UPI0024788DD7|nr:decapping nuclease DXO homolog [Uranotaenia lowii]